MEGQQDGNPNGLRARISRKLDHIFKDREIFLRGDGDMRYVSLSRRRQLRWAAAGLALGVWVVVSTAGLIGLGFGWLDARREIAQQRLTYLDFLSEVGGYHQELGRVIEDFESNQSMLISRLELASGSEPGTSGLRSELERTETDKARVLLVRERVRTGLQDLESELQDIAARDADLRERLDSATRSLEETQAEGSALAAARDRLDQALAQSEGRVGDLEAENAALRRRVAELETSLADADKELERRLAEAAEEKEALVADGAALRAEIASLYAEIADAPNREAQLQGRVEALESELEIAVASAESMADQRDFYQIRAGSLESQLKQVSEAQKAVITRLSERTLRGIDMIERIVAMTGLNVNELILGLELAGPRDNQGGPFVPGDFLIGDDPYQRLQSSVALLDQQMTRWEALQEVIRVLPLASPLDQYRVTSGYGERKDPVNGRRARHDGIDLKAPLGSAVLATAPGTVSFAGWHGSYGRMVEIDHGNGIRTRYGHLRKILVKAGQEVAYREQVGQLGSSGRSTGPHVHYEVLVNDETYDPSKFLLAGRNAFKE